MIIRSAHVVAGFNVHCVAVLVDGTVYVDDEPCWRNLLKSRGTYAIVYRECLSLPCSHTRLTDSKVRRPIWQPGLLVWLCDLWNQTPLIDAQDVPKRRRKYTTEQAYTKLVKRATMVATEPRPCVHSRGSYWIWNKRGESEITDAEKLGRSVVYERMRLFNPAPEKEATIALARTC